MTVGGQYPASAPASAFHFSLPVVLSNATTAPPGPPTMHTTASAITSGWAANPPVGTGALQSLAKSFVHSSSPVLASRQNRWPIAPSAYTRPPSTAGVQRGPHG